MSGPGKGGYSVGPGTGDAHVGHPDEFFPKGPVRPKKRGGSYVKGGGSSGPSTSKRPKLRPGSGSGSGGGSYVKGGDAPNRAAPSKKSTPKRAAPSKKTKRPNGQVGQDYFSGSTGGPKPKRRRYPGDKQHPLKLHET